MGIIETIAGSPFIRQSKTTVDSPFIREISFVADEHDENVRSSFGSNIINPLGSLLEGVGIY
jgi:hypothetical protein